MASAARLLAVVGREDAVSASLKTPAVWDSQLRGRAAPAGGLMIPSEFSTPRIVSS